MLGLLCKYRIAEAGLVDDVLNSAPAIRAELSVPFSGFDDGQSGSRDWLRSRWPSILLTHVNLTCSDHVIYSCAHVLLRGATVVISGRRDVGLVDAVHGAVRFVEVGPDSIVLIVVYVIRHQALQALLTIGRALGVCDT